MSTGSKSLCLNSRPGVNSRQSFIKMRELLAESEFKPCFIDSSQRQAKIWCKKSKLWWELCPSHLMLYFCLETCCWNTVCLRWGYKHSQKYALLPGFVVFHYGLMLVSLPMPLHTVYPKKYAHGFVVLCFVVVMQSFIMNSHVVFIHIHQGCFAGTGAIVRLPQCQWSKPDGYGKISQCITTTKHSKAKTVCIFLGIYCITL